MKFLISEARKRKSILFVSGYLHPENDKDAEYLDEIVKRVEEYHIDRNKHITLDRGTIVFSNATYSCLINPLKILSSDITISPEPEESIRYIGNINEEGLKRALSSMLDGWSGNKTV